jgi:hypothetical protein
VLNVSTVIFLDSDWRYRDLPKLFLRMPFLRSLTINISNKCLAPRPSQIEENILRDSARGSVEDLINTTYAMS